MSSINSFFGSAASRPSINNLNSGLSLTRADDSTTARQINSFGNNFATQLSPIQSSGPFAQGFDPLGRNPNAFQVLTATNGLSGSINPPMNVDPNFMFPVLPNAPYTDQFQPLPDFGTNPNSLAVLAATTQFQSQLETVGPKAMRGFPIVNLPYYPSALDYQGVTTAFENFVAPYKPGAGTPGTILPNAYGSGTFYPSPSIQPYNPAGYGKSYNPHYPGGSAVVPYPPPPVSYPAYPGLYGQVFPQPKYPTGTIPANSGLYISPVDKLINMANVIRNNIFELPDYIPRSVPGGIKNFIKTFNQLPESERVKLRMQWANPTTVDMNVLNNSGIVSTGGLYNQGTVNNPFKAPNFLQDTNPFARFNSGLVVTNGNGNGKVKGTPVNDAIVGTKARRNIIDGFGGQDNIFTGSMPDLVNVHQGDWIFTGSDNDIAFYDFTQPFGMVNRPTVIDMYDGNNDTLVLTVAGNASDENNTPVFTRLNDGWVRVTKNGQQILANGVDRFIVVDQQGNIGGIYQAVDPNNNSY